MAKSKIAPGQIWRHDASGAHYLVTRVYSELFDQFAILRRVEGEETMRVRVRTQDPSRPLPGYTQESGEFQTEPEGGSGDGGAAPEDAPRGGGGR